MRRVDVRFRLRAVRAAVPLVAAGLMAGSVAVAPAHAAAAPVPAPRPFGPVADAFPRWEPESSCSPTAKPGAVALQKLLKATYPSIGSNIVRPCTGADSGHEEGRAIDWMTSVRVPEQKALADAFVAWLLAPDEYGNQYAMARRLGVQYLIWNSRMWRLYDPGRGWTEYSGCLHKPRRAKKYDNTCHRTHVHISMTWDGAYERTSYFSGYVACPTFPTPAPAPALPTTGVDFVPVRPARILNTAGSNGTPDGPCRMRGATRFDLPVLGRGGVPESGVSAVVLRITLARPDSATSLRVWPTGARLPKGAVLFANPGQAASVVTVPVGSAGSVSLQHATGMTHATVDVLGYYLAPGATGDLFHPVGPTSLVSDQAVAPHDSVSLDLGAASHVDGVTAGVLSVTMAADTRYGAVRLGPGDEPLVPMSSMTVPAHGLATETLVARTAADGTTVVTNTSAKPVTMSVDLQGVYAPADVPGGLSFVPLDQSRIVDSARDVGVVDPMTGGRTATFPVLGVGGVPSEGVGAVLGSLISRRSTTASSLTFWPAGTDQPDVRQLSPQARSSAADNVFLGLGDAGQVSLYSAAGRRNVSLDVTGWFGTPTG